MTKFLTVKEAARTTGKSPSSIRRIIYPILETENHLDRPQIQPTIEEVQQFRVKGENFAWRISEELLRREVPPESASEKGADKLGARSLHDSDAELLSMLRGELDIKNQQIKQRADMLETQMALIEGLSERLREGNILIGSLQQQLVLTDGATRGKSKSVDAEVKNARPESPASQSPSKPAPKTPTKTTVKPQQVPPKSKKGFFLRMFH